jgi:molecular chaperone GrpE
MKNVKSKPVEPVEVAADEEVVTADAEVLRLEEELQKARMSELRAMADYQNLVRRTQDERIKIVKMASRDVIENILQPLDHLFLAQAQLKDKGLDMVAQQFQRSLQEQGLEEIDCVGKEFDPTTMEVVTKEVAEDKKQVNKVIKVVQKGYTLNGEVIRHAKVIIGE